MNNQQAFDYLQGQIESLQRQIDILQRLIKDIAILPNVKPKTIKRGK